MSDSIEELLFEAYSATHDMLKDPGLGSVVQHGLLISYGPPLPNPDLLFLSFQGAGNTSRRVQDTWPQKLRCLDSQSKFNTTLRDMCYHTELFSSLQSSAMAFPTVFPQALSKEAGRWMRKTGPYPVWRDHAKFWVERLVKVIKPKVVIVFGVKASKVFDISWEDVEHNHGGGHQHLAITYLCTPA